MKIPVAAIPTVLLLSAIPALRANTPPVAQVGSLEYIEGTAYVNGHEAQAGRSSLPVLANGQVLETGDGHAEMLLTPGVFLRLDRSSRVRLLNSGLTDTRLRVESGAAMLEVDNMRQDNLLRVDLGNGSVQILKNGLYRFSAAPPAVEVLNGQVAALSGDTRVKAGKHRQVTFSPAPVVAKFHTADDELSKWSRLRSEYEAEASAASAQYVIDAGEPWNYAGWYWSPWYSTWTWFPASGMMWNPYGFGFYSPWAVYSYAPVHAYGIRRPAYGGYHGGMRMPAGRMPAGSMHMGMGRMGGGRMGGRR